LEESFIGYLCGLFLALLFFMMVFVFLLTSDLLAASRGACLEIIAFLAASESGALRHNTILVIGGGARGL
jgi:hypothetical protein